MHRWQYRSIVIRFATVASQICEITRNSEKIQTYSSSRSSKVINLAANRKHICKFLLVINSNIGRISYCFRDWRITLENRHFRSLYCDCRPLAEERPAIFQRYLRIVDSTGLSSIVLPLLPLKSAKSREIPRKFELIALQGHPRSSTLVPIESAYATSY